jgi:hypothetical protein
MKKCICNNSEPLRIDDFTENELLAISVKKTLYVAGVRYAFPCKYCKSDIDNNIGIIKSLFIMENIRAEAIFRKFNLKKFKKNC